MSFYDVITAAWDFNRQRTLATLDAIAEQPQSTAALGWQPGEGRAHIAWQLMHIGVTEEVFATARLRESESESVFADWIPRFRGGSTPDDDIPSVEQIRQLLGESRKHLLETVSTLSESDLETIPTAMAKRGWSIRTALYVLAWHEPHHQGQAHSTWNQFRAQAQ